MLTNCLLHVLQEIPAQSDSFKASFNSEVTSGGKMMYKRRQTKVDMGLEEDFSDEHGIFVVLSLYSCGVNSKSEPRVDQRLCLCARGT